MRRSSTGTYQTTTASGEPVRSFVPHPLPPPPQIPPRETLGHLLEAAATALGRLDAVTPLLPAPAFMVYGPIRKEAILSSRIEGIRSSLTGLMLHDAGRPPAATPASTRETAKLVP
ncbi:MAG: Fic family protein, partial [Gemmatimonadetes bacterium]|nr:Fic family protein [Gemmatimonadota bacterium]